MESGIQGVESIIQGVESRIQKVECKEWNLESKEWNLESWKWNLGSTGWNPGGLESGIQKPLDYLTWGDSTFYSRHVSLSRYVPKYFAGKDQ